MCWGFAIVFWYTRTLLGSGVLRYVDVRYGWAKKIARDSVVKVP